MISKVIIYDQNSNVVVQNELVKNENELLSNRLVTFDQDYSRKELNLRTDIFTKYNLIPGEEYILQMYYSGTKIKDKKMDPAFRSKEIPIQPFRFRVCD